jgi:hypothetical protein
MWRLLESFRAIVVLAMVASAASETHELKLNPATVHWGFYDPRLKPVLRVASGDTVRVETMVAGGLERLVSVGINRREVVNERVMQERSSEPS